MSHHWIDTEAGLHKLLEATERAETLFLDTEFMRERTYWPRLALLQVRAGEEVFLVDAPALAGHSGLHDLLAGRRVVMHACSEDMEALAAFGCALPGEVVDTQVGAALCGHSLQCSYQQLVRERLGIELPKDATRSDWLQRPLEDRQRAYAEQDVLHLPALYEGLGEELEKLGRIDWWREECRRLLDVARSEVAPEDAWRQVKGAGGVREPRPLARLARLAAWREQTARDRDLPRGFVIRDGDLLALAQRGARSLRDLEAMSLHPALLRRHGRTLLAVLAEVDETAAPRPLPEPAGPEERRQIKSLRGKVREQARALGLEPEVLARRRWLEALARDPATVPEPMTGWRRGLVAEPLRELLS